MLDFALQDSVICDLVLAAQILDWALGKRLVSKDSHIAHLYRVFVKSVNEFKFDTTLAHV